MSIKAYEEYQDCISAARKAFNRLTKTHGVEYVKSNVNTLVVNLEEQPKDDHFADLFKQTVLDMIKNS